MSMGKVIKITESELTKLVERIIKESHYDRDKLYSRERIVNLLKKAPRELKSYAKDLPEIPCTDSQGNEHMCTKIPEVVHVYMSGKY